MPAASYLKISERDLQWNYSKYLRCVSSSYRKHGGLVVVSCLKNRGQETGWVDSWAGNSNGSKEEH